MNRISGYAVAAGFLVCVSLNAFANDEAVAHFTVVRGEVDLKKQPDLDAVPAVVGLEAYLGNVVRTKERSRAQLTFIDDSVVNLGSNYNVEIKEFSYDAEKKVRNSVIRSMRGTLRAIVSKVEGPSTFEIETPSAVASVRGTDFFTVVRPDGATDIVVVEGAVAVRNIDPAIRGEVLVGPSQFTRIQHGQAPLPARQVRSESIQILERQAHPGSGDSEGRRGAAAPIAAPLGTPRSRAGDVGDGIMAMSAGAHEENGAHAGGAPGEGAGSGHRDLSAPNAAEGAGMGLGPAHMVGNTGGAMHGNLLPPPVTPPVTSSASPARTAITIQLQFP